MFALHPNKQECVDILVWIIVGMSGRLVHTSKVQSLCRRFYQRDRICKCELFALGFVDVVHVVRQVFPGKRLFAHRKLWLIADRTVWNVNENWGVGSATGVQNI